MISLMSCENQTKRQETTKNEIPKTQSADHTKIEIQGIWNEISPNNYLQMNIQFHGDSSARFHDRYPEQSTGLMYKISSDSLILYNDFGVISKYIIQNHKKDKLMLQCYYPKELRSKEKIFLEKVNPKKE